MGYFDRAFAGPVLLLLVMGAVLGLGVYGLIHVGIWLYHHITVSWS